MQIHSLCAFKSVKVLEDSLQKKATPETRLFSGVHGPPRGLSGKESSGSLPGSGRSPGEGNGKTHASILAWKIPWTEEPLGLEFIRLQSQP